LEKSGELGKDLLGGFGLDERLGVLADAVTPTAAATSVFDKPAAHLKTIQERNANAWQDLRRRSHPTSCSRSRSINSRTALRRPVLGTTKDPINPART
jgi:hypothetical protein